MTNPLEAFVEFYLRAGVKNLCFDADNSRYRPTTHQVVWEGGTFHCSTGKLTGFRSLVFDGSTLRRAFEPLIELFLPLLPFVTTWESGKKQFFWLADKPYLPLHLAGAFWRQVVNEAPDQASRTEFINQSLRKCHHQLKHYLPEDTEEAWDNSVWLIGRPTGSNTAELRKEILACRDLNELFYSAGQAGRADLFRLILARASQPVNLQRGLEGACAGGHEDLVRVALAAGGKITHSAIDAAIKSGHLDLLPYLMADAPKEHFLVSSINAKQPAITEWLLAQITPTATLLMNLRQKAQQKKLAGLVDHLEILLSSLE